MRDIKIIYLLATIHFILIQLIFFYVYVFIYKYCYECMNTPYTPVYAVIHPWIWYKYISDYIFKNSIL